MSVNLEFEAKSMLTKNEYDLLKKEFRKYHKYNQTNFYIFSDEIDTKKLGMRIRKKLGKFELTIKIDKETFKKEINQKITWFSYVFYRIFRIFPKGEVESYIKENSICDIKKLIIIGSMKTKRIDVKKDNNLISIDYSKYNSTKDYEIECESSSIKEAENYLKEFLKRRNIEYKKSKYTKLARFLNTK